MASIFRKPGKQNWWVTYYRSGKRVRHSLKTRDQRIALRKLKKLEADLITGQLEERTSTPIEPLLQAFCEFLETSRTRKSYKNDVAYLRGFFGAICEAIKPGGNGSDALAARHVHVQTLEQVTPALVDRFITIRIRDDGIGPKTANRIREVLHVMFNYAIRQHGFRSPDRRYPNPVDAVPRRKESDPQIRFLTLEQIQEQLEALEGRPVIRALVAVYIYAGFRREEALWLTQEDVDLDRRLIRVRAKTIDKEQWQPKTRRNRAVPISSALFEILKAYEPPKGTAWFFPSPTGKRWHPDNFSQDLRAINAKHGLPWGCLDFRHTFGSQLAQKGESLFKISTLMGNSPEICRRHYAALVPEAMHDTVEFGTRPHLRVIPAETCPA